MNLTTLGIDLAKTSFSLVGMDQHGKVVLRKTLKRAQLLPFIAQCPTCLIGMEACSGAHYWGREFTKLGHKVGIIASKFIAPFRKGGKNDNNDAEAICEAVGRSTIWFVPVKTAEQQAQLCVHRVRQGLVSERTALINQLRGLLSEFGIVMPKGRYLRMCLVHGARSVLANLKDKQDKVSCWARELIARRGYLRAIVAMAARNARLIWTLMVKQEDYKILPANA